MALLRRPTDHWPRVPACLGLQLTEMHVSGSPAASLHPFSSSSHGNRLQGNWARCCIYSVLGSEVSVTMGTGRKTDGSGAARLLSSLSGTPILTPNPLLPSVPLSSGCKPLSVAGTRPGDSVCGREKVGLLEHP